MASPFAGQPLPPKVDQGPSILAVTWVLSGLGLLIVGARMYSRGIIIKNIGSDDWTMVFATVLALVTSILVTLEVQHGMGQHAVYIPPPDLIKAVEITWLTAPFSTMSACFGKISIALLLMRIDSRNQGRRAFLWTMIVLLFIVNLILTIITFAQCTPVTFLWDRVNPHVDYHGTCWDTHIQTYYGYFQGAFSSLSDLVLALFPILIVWNLQMKLKLKIGLAVIMGLGVIATFASIYKTCFIGKLANPDFTYDSVDLVYWYITENWLIIIAACFPTLGPLYMVTTGRATMASFNKGTPRLGVSGWTRWRPGRLFSRGSSKPSKGSYGSSSGGYPSTAGRSYGMSSVKGGGSVKYSVASQPRSVTNYSSPAYGGNGGREAGNSMEPMVRHPECSCNRYNNNSNYERAIHIQKDVSVV